LELNKVYLFFVYPFEESMGKLLIIIGVIIIIVGIIVHFFDGIPFLGKLPGDIHIKRENFSFHFPVASSIVVSIILSLIIYLINKCR